MIIYRIQNSKGLFSSGGMFPVFKKIGKIWKRKGDLHSHLLCAIKNINIKSIYNNCRIVSYKIEEIELEEKPVLEFISELEDSSKKKEESRKEAWQKYIESQERKQPEELKKKYE